MGEAEPAAATATVDEAVLVAGLKARRPEAFETLVRTYTPRLLAVAMRMLGSPEDAQDVVQDAMLSAYGPSTGLRATRAYRPGCTGLSSTPR